MEFVNDYRFWSIGGNSSHFTPGFSKSSSHNKYVRKVVASTDFVAPHGTPEKHKKNLRVSSSAGATCSSPAAKSHWDRWVAVRPCGPRFRNHQAPGVLRARSRWAWKVHEGPVFTIGQHGSVFWYVLVNSNYLDSNASNFIKLFGNDILVEAMHVPTKRYVLLHAVPSAMC
jgi:hypothetical protein